MQEEAVCSICYEAGTDASLHCGHTYHLTCITPWAIKAHTCPVCRAAGIGENGKDKKRPRIEEPSEWLGLGRPTGVDRWKGLSKPRLRRANALVEPTADDLQIINDRDLARMLQDEIYSAFS